MAGTSGCAQFCVQPGFLLSKTMGKRSAFFLAILLVASIVQVRLPVAAAQMSDEGDSGCPSGITSPVDGSCVGSDQSQSMTMGQQNPTQSNAAGQGYSGQSLSLSQDQLLQQYPGLQNQGMNGRIPTFNDRSGLTSWQARQQALYEAQALAMQAYQPPTEFQQLVRGSLGKMLPVYGDSLFRRVPSTFAPLWFTPVTPDYVLGPGDQLVIRIWGQVNFNAELTIDRSGSVYLPKVGDVHVAGLPYSELQQHLHDAIGRIYRNFNLSVELGQLRSIQVFLVGQARRPGTYTVSSLSTLVTALFATGGPSVQGSLRDIQVKRGSEIVTHFDLYDLLINGDKSKDVPLLSGDVIYIPPVGPQVAVGGSVRVPAIYELKGPTSVSETLRFAGGLSTTASLERASIERIDGHKDRRTLDISLEGAGLETALRQGDILYVVPISPQFQNTVTLRGNVAVPGRFTWHPGMKLSEIVPDSKSLITRDYWERRNQLGIPGPEFKPEYAMNPDLYPRTPNGYRRTQNNAPRPYSNGQPQTNGNQNYNNQYNPNANPGAYPNSGPISGGNPDQNLNQYGDQGQYGQYNDQYANQNCDPNYNGSQDQTQSAGNYEQGYYSGNPQNGQQGLEPCSPGGNTMSNGNLNLFGRAQSSPAAAEGGSSCPRDRLVVCGN